jgi:hypothetical protein
MLEAQSGKLKSPEPDGSCDEEAVPWKETGYLSSSSGEFQD